jgi:4-amino-4-deoxy-L-arabinose transferase-like glycosyltransferase
VTLAVYSLARRFVDRKLAVTAAGLFLVQPLLLDHRVVGNIDIMLAYFYICSIILAFDVLRVKPGLRSYLAVSALAGFMLGLKYTSLVLSLSLILVPVLAYPGRLNYKRLVIGVIVAMLVFAPWAVKNQAYIGNPVHPLLESRFDGDNWDRVQESQLVQWQRSMGMGRGFLDYLLLPFNVSIRGRPGLNYRRFDGTIGPLLLILLPLALLRRERARLALIAMALAGFVFWALTSQQLRFLIPTIAVLSVLASTGISNLRDYIGSRLTAAVLVVIILIGISSIAMPNQYGRQFLSDAFGERLGAVTGLEPRKDYLGRNLQSFDIFEYINRRIPRHEPIFLIWENRGYYLDHPYFADSFFEASTLMRMVSEAPDSKALKARIGALGYRYVVVNNLLGEAFLRYYPPEQARTLGAFINDHLKPVHSSNRITLYSILPD